MGSVRESRTVVLAHFELSFAYLIESSHAAGSVGAVPCCRAESEGAASHRAPGQSGSHRAILIDTSVHNNMEAAATTAVCTRLTRLIT